MRKESEQDEDEWEEGSGDDGNGTTRTRPCRSLVRPECILQHIRHTRLWTLTSMSGLSCKVKLPSSGSRRPRSPSCQWCLNFPQHGHAFGRHPFPLPWVGTIRTLPHSFQLSPMDRAWADQWTVRMAAVLAAAEVVKSGFEGSEWMGCTVLRG